MGSRNEHRGATGIAHFLEHLMFRGTPTYGPGQYAKIVERNGGHKNAFTMQYVTSY
ncbi:MAG: insulinase family protein [Candidatus Rokuibacteriota bacterium]